jgi:hypothetical protein
MGCSVAALCRGLRYEGDITLKEVAMAFQLRDAYDWDEDLEAAAAHEVRHTYSPLLTSCSGVLSKKSLGLVLSTGRVCFMSCL